MKYDLNILFFVVVVVLFSKDYYKYIKAYKSTTADPNKQMV
jgi:hypothetical protein